MGRFKVMVRGFPAIFVEASNPKEARYKTWKEFNEAYPTPFKEFLGMVSVKPATVDA